MSNQAPINTSALVAQAALKAAAHKPYRPLPREAAPTLALNTSALAGSQTVQAFVSGVLNTKKFGFYGPALSTFAPRGSAYPQYNVAHAIRATADTAGAPVFETAFYYTGAGTFDFVRYGDGLGGADIYVDGQFFASVGGAVATGTAQAGAAAAITLAAGASATTGMYNQCYARITGGTGAGQIQQITAYNGSTKVATVSAAWATVPDATSTYSIEGSPAGAALDGLTGSLKYLNLTLPVAIPAMNVVRQISIFSSQFVGINIGQNDCVWPAPPSGQFPMICVGDSFFFGTAGPLATSSLFFMIARQMGCLPINLSSGSTGLWTRGGSNRLNFLNRVAPPAEAWTFVPPSTNGATAGTWAISVTYNGTTQTATLAYNASIVTIENALNALSFNGFTASSGVSWVGPTGQGCFCAARGDLSSPLIVIANGMVGATVSIDSSGLTGGAAGALNPYLGDVAINLPKDVSGTASPFILLVPGSGNDTSAAGFTDAALQANAISLAQQIAIRFPTAVPMFTGIITNSDGGGSGVISTIDLGHNTALKTGAQLLPKINGQTPFIDTYSAGVGGDCWFTGAGTIGNPTNGKNDGMKSLLAPGHPTGVGAGYLSGRMVTRVFGLLRGLLDGSIA